MLYNLILGIKGPIYNKDRLSYTILDWDNNNKGII